ncbi:hypothetical protein [Furfurilactobacillus entadae]|uniref:hypothetical protein n=1 Tax=Furfurilactobacillus entadae TaxID=2922307 RepID=UPI0035F0ED13
MEIEELKVGFRITNFRELNEHIEKANMLGELYHNELLQVNKWQARVELDKERK